MNYSSTRIANTWLTKRATHYPKVVDGLKMFEANFRGPKISELSWFPEPVHSSTPSWAHMPITGLLILGLQIQFSTKNEWNAASLFSRSQSPSANSWKIASNAPIREKTSDYTASRSPGSTSTDGFNMLQPYPQLHLSSHVWLTHIFSECLA